MAVKKLHGGHLTDGSNVAHVALVAVLAAVVVVAVVEVVKVTVVAFRSGSKCWKTLRRNKKVNFKTRSKNSFESENVKTSLEEVFFQNKKIGQPSLRPVLLQRPPEVHPTRGHACEARSGRCKDYSTKVAKLN